MTSPPERPIVACVAVHSSGLGGAERSHLERCLDLRAEGVTMHSLIPAPDRGLGRELRAAGLPVSFVPGSPWWISVTEQATTRRPGQPLHEYVSEQSVHALMSAIARVQPDVVLTVTSVDPHAAIAARALGIPHVWFIEELAVPVHGLHPTVAHTEIGRAIRALSGSVVCASRAVRDHFFGPLSDEEALGQDLHVIYSAPRIPSGDEAPTDPRNDGAGSTVVGVIGTFIEGKGQRVAVEALGLLSERGVGVRMILFGSGPDDEVEALQRRAGELGVDHLLELRFEHDRSQIFAAVDLVAVTSTQEGFTRVPFEAAASHRPIVYADEGSSREVMVPDVTGIPFAAHDPDSLADAIERLAGDPDLRGRLAASARAQLEAFCARPARGAQLREVIASAASRPALDSWTDVTRTVHAAILAGSPSDVGPADGADDDVEALRTAYQRMQQRLERTLSRRPVRLALFVAGILRSPLATLASVRTAAGAARLGPLDDDAYGMWIADAQRPGGALDAGGAAETVGVTFSLIMPVCDPPPTVLEEAIASVRGQQHVVWELLLVDDASQDPGVVAILESAASSDARITLLRNHERAGIVAATNRGIARANHRWIAFIDHDDLLPDGILEGCAAVLAREPQAKVAYTDEDKIDVAGRRRHPRFKPRFDPVRLLHENYLNHLALYRHDLVVEVGALHDASDGSQDWDLAIRATSGLTRREVVHIPRVGYHWRQTDGQFSRSHGSVAQSAGMVAVQRRLDQLAMPMRARPHPRLQGAVSLEPSAARPNAITVVMPVSNATPDGIRRTAQNIRAWHAQGVGAVAAACASENGGDRLRSELARDGLEATVVILPRATTRSLLASAIAQVHSEVVLVVDESLAPVEPTVASTLLGYLTHPGVALVGPRVLSMWGLLEHGPQVLSDGRLVSSGTDVHPSVDGYYGELAVAQQVAALGAMCFAARTETLERLMAGRDGEDGSERLALALSGRAWQGDEATVWVPTVSVRRRPRDGDPARSGVDLSPADVAAAFGPSGGSRPSIPGLHPALEVVDGALVLRPAGSA